MLEDIQDMYWNHPLSSAIRSLRYKPYVRNILYGGVALTILYALYNSVQRHESLSYDFPEEVTVPTPPQVWDERARQVKRAFLHAYHGYERYAAPHDELKPVSTGYKDNFNGWGVSIFDSLDTMVLLGLEGEYERARSYVEKTQFELAEHTFVPYFETTIRYLGGLLSTYALNQDPMLLKRADELAKKLDPVFNTPSKLALFGVNPSTGEVVGPDIGILAEMATLQLEYTYLAKATGNRAHWERRYLQPDLRQTGGMFPIGWNLTTGQPHDTHLSYLLKQYLLTAKTDKANLEMYIRATTHIITNLMYISPTRHLLYVTDTTTPTHEAQGTPTHVFEHLSCFLPGLFALGAHTLPLDDLDSMGVNLWTWLQRVTSAMLEMDIEGSSSYNLKELHMWAAEGLAQTCWLTYADMRTGLGPDETHMRASVHSVLGEGHLWMDSMDRWKQSGARGIPPGVGDKPPVIYTEQQRLRGGPGGRDYAIKKPGYLLRPETIESLYIMWRVTGDAKWRERGWRIFEAIERHTKTPYGYASIKSVEVVPPPKDDDMPSYFLAETYVLSVMPCISGSNYLPQIEVFVFNVH
ncbi:glycoside hydrolase family 47 protein [Desarmillaria tabescens]|uniref:alpha-1,2-Mannosidase n=1 Tax=Armillaria tabescens TaxID=1929756 RepID=A0AA39TQQ2_ARMTA|nr:glycoside hydrolase family 47 protein [Desarmillaria tabescens]KAK0467187.1 glycoside hydrolase family 47 protein [Desarmillaria tabescens]